MMYLLALFILCSTMHPTVESLHQQMTESFLFRMAVDCCDSAKTSE